MPTAIKLSDPIVSLARSEGRVLGRSIAGQVEHWARLGRAVERAPGFDYERVRAALSAQASFDDLRGDEQAVALAELDEYLENLPREGEEEFFARLRAAGVPVHGETGRRSPRKALPDRRRKPARRG
jgi:hypothetical protein